MSNWIPSRKVVMVGKGPSTRFVPKSKDYKIACLNNAIYNCEEVDYWFCHDQDNVDLIKPEQWSKIKNAIIPTYPQKPHPGGFEEGYKFNVWTDLIRETNPDVNFHLVSLGVHDMNSLPRLQIDDEMPPHMGETYSVLQTAATWLGMFKKVDHLITCGLDPEGGYHPMFQTLTSNTHGILPCTDGDGVWTKEATELTHKLFHDIASQYGYNIHRMTDGGTAEQVV